MLIWPVATTPTHPTRCPKACRVQAAAFQGRGRTRTACSPVPRVARRRSRGGRLVEGGEARERREVGRLGGGGNLTRPLLDLSPRWTTEEGEERRAGLGGEAWKRAVFLFLGCSRSGRGTNSREVERRVSNSRPLCLRCGTKGWGGRDVCVGVEAVVLVRERQEGRRKD